MTQIIPNIFLGCFIVGFILTATSFLFGGGGGHGHFHVGHFHIDLGGHGHAGGGHGHTHFGGHGHGHAGGGHGGADSGSSYPFLSYSGLVMFLTCFGAAGLILNRQTSGAVLISLLGASIAGIVGAVVVFLFMSKFLMAGEVRMDPTDYQIPGTLARITSPIRVGGTGEIMYVHGGTRKTFGARSEQEGVAHERGEEVMIVRCEKGIAYVKSVAAEMESGLERLDLEAKAATASGGEPM